MTCFYPFVMNDHEINEWRRNHKNSVFSSMTAMSYAALTKRRNIKIKAQTTDAIPQVISRVPASYTHLSPKLAAALQLQASSAPTAIVFCEGNLGRLMAKLQMASSGIRKPTGLSQSSTVSTTGKIAGRFWTDCLTTFQSSAICDRQ